MTGIVLTQYDGFILGPIAKVLGYLMEGIFSILDLIGIPNIGLSIILFTIVIYLLLMPLTIKQQKFSKLSAKMNPELQAIQAKYKNKKDNESMMAMNAETQAVYAKYGVSPSGSCIQLLIQMPILFALYRVIYAMPAYVGKIGDTFRVLADKIISVDNAAFLQNSGVEEITKVVTMYGKGITEGNIQNGVVDVLNKLTSTDMSQIASHYDLMGLRYQGEYILSQLNANGEIITRGLIDRYNNFLGINIGNSPSYMVGQAWNADGGTQWLLIIVALIIPVLSAVTQWINTKLMPQADMSNQNDQQNSMAQSMKMMNTMMPVMSAFFCFTLPAGMGLYWIAGSVVRSIQQVVINRHIDKIDIDELIKKNVDKRNKKLEKAGIDPKTLNKNATLSTKNVNTNRYSMSSKAQVKSSQSERDEAMKKSTEYYNNNAKPGSLAAKANMVKQYNEKNNK
ncbi:YidC/Oxa1 family membrane protein insertase [Lachnospiraceae bacterium 10-1]|nr:YidC/Oxa1 family membrane protein insertase [Lachnospiraceae bacterium 10-1]